MTMLGVLHAPIDVAPLLGKIAKERSNTLVSILKFSLALTHVGFSYIAITDFQDKFLALNQRQIDRVG